MSSPQYVLLMIALACSSLNGCAQATPEIPNDAAVTPAQARAPSPTPVAERMPDAGPDQPSIETPPDGWHGNWRLLAADDPHAQALMALSIQSSAGEASGSGDYALHQPFCDAVANAPISGTADCELIGIGGAFDRVEASPARLLLIFHPTADGMQHRLELRHEGERLVGEYVFAANDIKRAVLAERSPVQ